jgi:hypothetical protein
MEIASRNSGQICLIYGWSEPIESKPVRALPLILGGVYATFRPSLNRESSDFFYKIPPADFSEHLLECNQRG